MIVREKDRYYFQSCATGRHSLSYQRRSWRFRASGRMWRGEHLVIVDVPLYDLHCKKCNREERVWFPKDNPNAPYFCSHCLYERYLRLWSVHWKTVSTSDKWHTRVWGIGESIKFVVLIPWVIIYIIGLVIFIWGVCAWQKIEESRMNINATAKKMSKKEESVR